LIKIIIKKWVDVTAADPKLLISLKSYRNTVPVPQHWSQKRKYLQGKRGIEKLPFELPGKKKNKINKINKLKYIYIYLLLKYVSLNYFHFEI